MMGIWKKGSVPFPRAITLNVISSDPYLVFYMKGVRQLLLVGEEAVQQGLELARRDHAREVQLGAWREWVSECGM